MSGLPKQPEDPNLIVGFDTADDAGVYRLRDDLALVQTLDFFTPIVDDPYDFGAIAATNAISDVYAMGGTPLMAVAILGWPLDKLPAEVAQQVLAGGRSICQQAGIPLAGGHTIDTQDPVFGLAVTGTVHPKNLKKNNTAQEGDLLFLTKPLGTGILATAVKRSLLQEEHYEGLLQNMITLNSIGAELGKLEGVHAMTDVTGFGLMGHLLEMAEGSGLGAQLFYNRLQKLAGVETYLQQRITPDATFRNWNSYSAKVGFEKGVNVMEAFNLLPDPQTNGGLLIAVAPDGVEALKELLTLHHLQNHLQPIGVCTTKGEKTIVVGTQD